MASYLLLRDNKESGPFTINEMISLGFKPYDLVWIQGKSAAWRYPSEVDELKSFAPAVEEQPFDRFYKPKKEESPGVNEPTKYAPVAKQEDEKFIPPKSVFITLPDQKQVHKAIAPVQHIPSPSPTISITENPAASQIKYAQPLDEIKEMYVKTLQQRKDRVAKKNRWTNQLKKAAVFGGFIILAVLAGFVIKSRPRKSDTVVEKTTTPASLLINNNGVAETMPGSLAQQDSSTVDKPVAEQIQNNEPVIFQKIKEPSKPHEEPGTIRIRKETMLVVPKPKQEFDSRQVAAGAEMNAITGERERTARDNKTEENTVVKSNKNSLKDLVSVASNEYKRVAFGGIRNLYITVTNHSKYELDDVIVELQYLKPSEEPLRTENIKFKSIAANTSATIRIPDTNRGIKVAYKIINIACKQNKDAVAGM